MDSSKAGPDDTSLKPVSSLRAKFENMHKTSDFPTSAPAPRTSSPAPAPKPERLRDPKPLTHTDLSPPPIDLSTKPSYPVASAGHILGTQGPSTPTGTTVRTSSRLPSPSPSAPHTSKPPSVHIQPPLSPPKGRINSVGGDQSTFLNPDSVVNTPTSSHPLPRHYIIPNQPQSPVAEGSIPSKLTVSQPPSPPPPRRSGEIRRVQDAKPVPPPVNRAEKPNFAARNSYHPDSFQSAALSEQLNKRSPFNSPPESPSNSSTDSDDPPPKPTRPRPKTEIYPRPQMLHGSPFDPPPLHPSIASRRTEQEMNSAITRLSPQTTGDRPPLPARSSAAPELPTHRHTPQSAGLPPPRPPRPISQISRASAAAPPIDTTVSTSPPKRVVSTPTSQQPPAQLPSTVRPHGRSMTIDHTSDRAPSNIQALHIQSSSTHVTEEEKPEINIQVSSSLPDITRINRREPYIKSGVHEISTGIETRAIDACAHYVCTTTVHCTRVWSLLDGDQVFSIDHATVPLARGTAVKFKPGQDLQNEGTRVWVGDAQGTLVEFDVITGRIVQLNSSAHTRDIGSVGKKHTKLQDAEIVKIHRHYNELWTLDSNGTLQIWGPDTTGVPNLANAPHLRRWLGEGHTFSMVVDDELWFCAGKTIGVCLPTWEPNKSLRWMVQNIAQDNAGEICAGATLQSHSKKIFLGHADGRVSIYSRKDYSCLSILNVSPYKINSLAGVGDYLWAAYSSGRICVYDIDPNPWVVKKDWFAHSEPAVKLIADPSSFYIFDQSRVLSLAGDGKIRCWDGLLQEDWLEEQMRVRETKYCQFEDVRALVMTWNAGASTPFSLNQDANDARFFSDLLMQSGAPDIFVFGFQELVDLEDKSAAAKRWMKLGKKSKKAETDQERMKHQYRDWRDHLQKCLDNYIPGSIYHLLHCATMVGLFTCIFVKSTIQGKITNLSYGQVKRGLGGLDGNKGAVIIRFMLNNSSLCFLNCHLAAGQGQASDRHKDVAKIMDASVLGREPNSDVRIDHYVNGGDGTMIMDHDIVVLNGDLNYRIDTMSRDTVVIAVKQNNLHKLLERDQLLVTRRRNNAFRLRAFEELPITFAPTYKYDVGTDNYDTSEKKRSPAWCDRLLYRSRGKIQQLDYQRHEVRVSDHRPVTGRFVFKIKTISSRERAAAWIEAQQQFEDIKEKEVREEKMYYLTRVIGYDNEAAKQVVGIQERKRTERSPSRRRN